MNLQGKVSGNVLTLWLHAYQVGMRAIGESLLEPTTAAARGINALGNLSTWSEKMAVQMQRCYHYAEVSQKSFILLYSLIVSFESILHGSDPAQRVLDFPV